MVASTFTFHQDGGHGYIEVGLDLLQYLGIDQNISGYSYITGQNQGQLINKRVFLEEAQDPSLFMYAFEAIEKKRPFLITKSYEGLAPCRRYDRYPATSNDSFNETMQLINHYKMLCKRNRADVNEQARANNV